ncbi:MAG: hypothetical protein JWP58_219, partial [Hymenobacter sp.]|nr:hypothetical protein [Hymenobacter sp.]
PVTNVAATKKTGSGTSIPGTTKKVLCIWMSSVG